MSPADRTKILRLVLRTSSSEPSLPTIKNFFHHFHHVFDLILQPSDMSPAGLEIDSHQSWLEAQALRILRAISVDRRTLGLRRMHNLFYLIGVLTKNPSISSFISLVLQLIPRAKVLCTSDWCRARGSTEAQGGRSLGPLSLECTLFTPVKSRIPPKRGVNAQNQPLERSI